MVFWNRPVHESALLIAAICLNFSAGSAAGSQSPQAQAGQQPSSQTPAAARPVGTIKSISGNAITLTTDTGSDVTVQVQDATKLVRIAPGQKDLKEATPISVALPSAGEKKSVAVHLSKDTILRRYASDSVKFDDAKPAPLDQIKPGDQLRARGTRSSDGSELTADEIVSGTFRNLAGTISALDASAGTIIVQDLVSKKSITVRITAESQLRKLPAPMAQRIAMRLKGTSTEGQPSAPTPRGAGSTANAGQTAKPSGPPSGGSESGGSGGMGRAGGGGPADLQQMINRMPAATLADIQKGDAVMVVATEGGANGVSTVITLLGGVEPILEASPKSNPSTILSPWSLNSGGGGEAATP